MRATRLDDIVEEMCQKGCQAVHRDIRLLENGGVPPEVAGLPGPERQRILGELKAIMAVYGDRCGLD